MHGTPEINRSTCAALRPIFALLAACLLIAAPCMVQAQQGNKFRFTISNQTRLVVDEVRLSPSGENNWGPDYTGTSVLKPGQAIAMPDLAPGQYDVKFVDVAGNACTLHSIPVFSEMSWNLTTMWIGNCAGFGQARAKAAESGNRFIIKNLSRLEVLEIRMSPGGANQWGPDRTGDSALRPGGTFVLKDLAAGVYDLKFVVEDGDSCILKGINTAEQLSWNLTMQWLRGCGEYGTAHARSAAPSETGFRFTINNNSRFALNEIRVSAAGAGKWGPDRTGDMAVNAGETIILKNIEAGQYDVKFVDEDGDQCVLKDVKVAGHQSWDLTMQWLRSCEGFGPGRATAQKF
jgi:hypothetical protein